MPGIQACRTAEKGREGDGSEEDFEDSKDRREEAGEDRNGRKDEEAGKVTDRDRRFWAEFGRTLMLYVSRLLEEGKITDYAIETNIPGGKEQASTSVLMRIGHSAGIVPAQGRQEMAINRGMFTSAREDWTTPTDFFEELDREFRFDLDPCADDTNHKTPQYFTKEQDGLSQDWGGHRVFCNPPYGKEIGAWVRKAYEEGHKAESEDKE